MSAESNSKPSLLQLDKNFYQTLVDKNLDMTTVIGRSGQILYQAPAVERVLGYTPQKSVGTTVFEIVHPEDLEQAYGIIDRIVAGVVSEAAAELRFRHANGAYRHIHATAQIIGNDPEPMIVITSRDVTTQVLSSQMLTNTNELLSRVFSVSQSLLSITSPDTGAYIDVNDSWCQVLGYTRDEVIGKTELELGVWGSAEKRQTILDKLSNDGRLKQHTASLHTRSGDVRHVLIDAQFLTVAEETRVITSCQDVTDSILIEEELRQAQKMESLGQLTGGVAHDFNNLLGVTMGNAELLLLALDEQPKAKKYAQQILDATLRGADLTQQLLAFSRRQTLTPEQIDVQKLLQNMTTILQTTVSENTKIQYNFESESALCTVDPSQLENAILNLTLNARDAMPHGGQITYAVKTVACDEQQELPFPTLALPNGDYILLSVADTGHGMDEATRKRAVEPFFTTKDVGKGTGLGLSMVFGFAEQSGGAVYIDSELGNGTTVSLLFPLNQPFSQATLPESASNPAYASTGYAEKVVLVVEDNEPLRKLVALYLNEAGYAVREASGEHDIAEAIANLQQVHLLISDIVLQGLLTGPELAQRIHTKFPDVKTLFMTGYSGTESLDGRPLLQKPFTRNDFMQAVRRLI